MVMMGCWLRAMGVATWVGGTSRQGGRWRLLPAPAQQIAEWFVGVGLAWIEEA